MTDQIQPENTLEQTWARLDGVDVCVWRAGVTGNPVILLHGGGVDSALLSWREAILALSLNHRVFAPDLPGYGSTAYSPGLGNMTFYTQLLTNLMDHFGLPSASLVGISMGGGISLGFTLENPRRVDKLVLVDSYGLADRVRFHFFSWAIIKFPGIIPWSYKLMVKNRSMLRWSVQSIYGDPKRIDDAILDELEAVIHQPGAAQAFYELQNSDITPTRIRTCYMDRLSEISSPTLIIHGSKDNLVSIKYAMAANQRIPNSRLEIVDGAGHWPMRECPQEFNRLLVDFLS